MDQSRSGTVSPAARILGTSSSDLVVRIAGATLQS